MEDLQDTELVDTYRQRFRQYQMKTSQTEYIRSISNRLSKSLIQLERRTKALENLLILLKQQKDLHVRRREIVKENVSHIPPKLRENFLILEKRHEQLAFETHKSCIEIMAVTDYKMKLDNLIRSMEIEADDTLAEKVKYEKELEKQNTETAGIIEELSNDNVWNKIPHHDEVQWLLPSKFDQSEVEKMLSDKPHGTFLVRIKENSSHILYIIYNGEIKNYDIVKNNKNLFGFERCSCVFETLTELVLVYRVMSLAVHKDHVDVHLTFPIFADQEARSIIEECQVSRM